MKVLVVGNGGREHALAWKLAQSARVSQVFVAPGNGGTARDARLVNVPIAATDVVALREWAQAQGIALTVVGPEAPLAAGLVDEFRGHGLVVFGPTQAAAQLESSKAFSKAFMQRHRIPTAAYDTFSDAAAAHAYIDRIGAPIVVKADGLAAGKGVVVAMTLEEAHDAVRFMLEDNKFGVQHNDGGARVVIEAFLQGEEASFIVLCDGNTVIPLATSQDHKRLLNADQGPNTGGMGAYSPAPVVTPEVHERAMRDIILPTVAGMAADGIPYTGFLYAGLMIAPNGDVNTLEFNCRMGDPETQPILMRLQSDLAEVLLAAAQGQFEQAGTQLQWDSRCALGVVVAADGYPLTPRKGDVITQLPTDSADAVVFHAGTTLKDGQLQTSGGRVLCATALGHSVREAQAHAYALVRDIAFDGMQYRSDIGYRAIANEASPSPAQRVRAYLVGLQQRITDAITAADGQQTFLEDVWRKPEGERLQGDGITRIMEQGAVFERAGCGFSHVRGPQLPSSATQHRPELAGAPFEAMGVSLVFHPRNPYVPTVHMNVRMIVATPVHGGEPVCWFGGGMDLTPYYGFEEDAVHFHTVCRDALAPFGEDKYPRFKKWCDEYFFLKHRNEQRGVGGVFFDDFSELGFEQSFAMLQAVGNAFLSAYLPIVERRRALPYGERERAFQLYRRGRYVEFNLVWDRGTHFGLQSGGRSESILLSMPPLVSWAYAQTPEAGSPEARLYTDFLPRRDWV